VLKFFIIIQARLSSTRLPGKVFLKSNDGHIILQSQVKRLKLILKKINIKHKIIIAAPTKDKKNFTKYFKKNIFFGSEKNVLQRYYFCAKKFKAKNIIRVTSDDPLLTIDSFRIILDCLKKSKFTNNRLISLWHTKQVPHGSNITYLDFDALEKIYKNANNKKTKEHIIIFDNSFIKVNLILPKIPKLIKNSKIRTCIDTFEDYLRYRKSGIKFFEKLNFSMIKKAFISIK